MPAAQEVLVAVLSGDEMRLHSIPAGESRAPAPTIALHSILSASVKAVVHAAAPRNQQLNLSMPVRPNAVTWERHRTWCMGFGRKPNVAAVLGPYPTPIRNPRPRQLHIEASGQRCLPTLNRTLCSSAMSLFHLFCSASTHAMRLNRSGPAYELRSAPVHHHRAIRY